MGFLIEMHDCSLNFVDDTKTCVQLFLTDYFGTKTSVAYVFTAETQEEVLEKKNYYLEQMLNVIKENAEWT